MTYVKGNVTIRCDNTQVESLELNKFRSWLSEFPEELKSNRQNKSSKQRSGSDSIVNTHSLL